MSGYWQGFRDHAPPEHLRGCDHNDRYGPVSTPQPSAGLTCTRCNALWEKALSEDRRLRTVIEKQRAEIDRLRALGRKAVAERDAVEAEIAAGPNEAFRKRVIKIAYVVLHPEKWPTQPRMAGFAEARLKEFISKVNDIAVV